MIHPTEVEFIPIEQTEEFPEHPYRVELNKDMEELIKSIYLSDVIEPLIMWERYPERYIVLSGHRRRFACLKINETKLKNITHLPAEIYRDITLEEATIIMVDANLRREKILPSEKAKSYKMKLDAMKRKAGRPRKNNFVQSEQNYLEPNEHENLNSRQIVGNLETADIISDDECGRQVQRWARIAKYLIPELLDMFDDNKFGFSCAVELSYLTPDEQELVYEELRNRQPKLSLEQAKELKKKSLKGKFNLDIMNEILSVPRLDNRVTFRLKSDQLENLDLISVATDTNRSELLRAYSATGGTIYAGKDALGELKDTQFQVSRVGNLLKMHQNKLDVISQNPFLIQDDRDTVLAILEEARQLQTELDNLRRDIVKLCTNVEKSVRKLNAGKR